jgi:hypothetical protein
MLTAERLREVLNYDPQTGEFRWRIDRGRRFKAGMVAGSKTHRGYIVIRIDDALHWAHRLAWLHMTGEWPTGEMDHKDRNGINNVWSNLREASRGQNMVNSVHRNLTGFRGVNRKGARFQAQLKQGGRILTLGTFDTPEEAHAAYRAAAEKLHGEFMPQQSAMA